MKFAKTSEIIIKKSKFYGYLLENATEERVEEALKWLREQHKKATHVCYAYVLSNPLREKFSDDGEPSRTSGLRNTFSFKQEKTHRCCSDGGALFWRNQTWRRRACSSLHYGNLTTVYGREMIITQIKKIGKGERYSIFFRWKLQLRIGS